MRKNKTHTDIEIKPNGNDKGEQIFCMEIIWPIDRPGTCVTRNTKITKNLLILVESKGM